MAATAHRFKLPKGIPSYISKLKETVHKERIKDGVLYPYKDIQIPKMPVCEFLWKDFDKFSHLTGLVCAESGTSLLFGEIREQALEVSRSFQSCGLKKSDIVTLLLPNCIEYPLLVQGCLHSGLTLSPLNPASTHTELSTLLQVSKPKAIIAHSSLADKVKMYADSNSDLSLAVILGPHKSIDKMLSWKDFVGLSSGPLPTQVPVDPIKDIALLPFSSGTTGVPKGVMLSHQNLITENVAISGNSKAYMVTTDKEEEQDSTISVLPMYHIFGLNVTMTGCLAHGVKNVVMPGFNPNLFAEMSEKHKPNFLHLVPPLVRFLAQSPLISTEHLKNLRQVHCGGAPSGTELIKSFYDKAPQEVTFKEGWGLSEVAGGATGADPDLGVKLGSVNILLPNLRGQIRDLTNDKPLGPMEQGEILVKGPTVMLGYHNNEKANSVTFDKDGWMRTGDIGYYDHDGFLYIVDRQKELIKVKGMQVAPAELENVLRGMTGISDVGVIGVDSERSGEAPRAYIVLKDGANISEQDINNFMEEHMASYKQLTGGIEFVKEIPKSAAGKILRKEMVKEYKQKYGKQ